MTPPITVEFDIHFRKQGRGRKQMREGAAPPLPPDSAGRIPRVARLMALAIRFDGLIRSGDIVDYAEIATLGHVSRARVTQIMNLLLLAPDLQESILFLAPVERGRDPISFRDLQPIALEPDWRRQRKMWKELMPST